MKLKNYEKYSLILFLVIITFFLEIVFLILIINTKEYKYLKFTGIVTNKDNLLLIMTKDDKKIIYKNRYLYLNDKKIYYRVINDKNIIMKNNQKYYEVIIKCKLKDYKSNDTTDISIKDTKYRLIEIFKLIWDGDNYGKNK